MCYIDCHVFAQLLAPPRDARRAARDARKKRPDTAGDSWFDLPATQITPQVKLGSRSCFWKPQIVGVLTPASAAPHAAEAREVCGVCFALATAFECDVSSCAYSGDIELP